MNDIDIYSTKDTGISAMLICTGMIYLGIRWEGKIAFFQFEDPKECTKRANLFLYANIEGSLGQYNKVFHQLKREISDHFKSNYLPNY
jgi:hypothetical protein